MNITDVKIRKLFSEGPMRAVASATFDDCLAVHDIKVIYARDRYFIVMPSRKNPDGTYRDIVHPINSKFRAELEETVLRAYDTELLRDQNALGEDALFDTGLEPETKSEETAISENGNL